MQIDVLSQNTLKLTLSRLDMFDMDIKYESLSGKNPDTKRLLSHVLRTVKLDKSTGVDFSGERLFVEAFPRPDGGCMMYISALSGKEQGFSSSSSSPSDDRERVHLFTPDKKTVKLTAKPKKSESLLCCFDSLKNLEKACKSLSWQNKSGFTSALYSNGNEYRLFISGENKKLVSVIVCEFGELLDESELSFTNEHYKLLVTENAIEQMNSVAS